MELGSSTIIKCFSIPLIKGSIYSIIKFLFVINLSL